MHKAKFYYRSAIYHRISGVPQNARYALMAIDDAEELLPADAAVMKRDRILQGLNGGSEEDGVLGRLEMWKIVCGLRN
jgi:hypothetical protein